MLQVKVRKVASSLCTLDVPPKRVAVDYVLQLFCNFLYFFSICIYVVSALKCLWLMWLGAELPKLGSSSDAETWKTRF